MFNKKIFFILAVVSFFFFYSCAPKPMAPKAELDTPEHHVTNGNKLLKAEKLDAAFHEFNRAKELNPKFSPAYVGLGLVDGFNNNFKNSFNNMKEARKYARGDEQKIAVTVGFMRVYIMGKENADKNWFQLVKEEFDKSMLIAKDVSGPYFYMGLACKMSYKFHEAASQFSRVLELDKDYVKEADREYEIVQKIERAMPGSKIGKKIALVEKITRADIAALFIEELEIDEIFKKRTPKRFDTAFKSPEKELKAGEYVKIQPAIDIDDHVLKADIDAVIKIGIKGLQPFPDHTYKPYQTITRAEFAMMIEDIIIKVTGVDDLATRFIGSVSPFPDLRNDLPYFNAVIISTTRGIMTAMDLSTGEFDPIGTVSGADALLSIRALKSQL